MTWLKLLVTLLILVPMKGSNATLTKHRLYDPPLSLIERYINNVAHLTTDSFNKPVSKTQLEKVRELYPNLSFDKADAELIKYQNLITADTLINYIVEISGIPKSAVTSSLVVETDWFRSRLFTIANNLGGVKSRKGQPYILHDNAADGICKFAKYPSILDAANHWADVATSPIYLRRLEGNSANNWFLAWNSGGYWSRATNNGLSDRQAIHKFLFH